MPSTSRAKLIIVASLLVLALAVIVGSFVYRHFSSSDKQLSDSDTQKKRNFLINPAFGKTADEIAKEFNESFVLYLLAEIGAGELHNPPLSSETPKIEIRVDSDTYSAEIIDGKINVRRGAISNEDIRVLTTKEEAAKMLLNKNYILESFQQGKSSIEIVASKTKLVSKGYLSLYSKFS